MKQLHKYSIKHFESQDVARIVCKEDLLDKDFAFYLISSALVKQQLSATAQQTKIRHTSLGKIKDCTVWIPELAEQKRIGKLLRSLNCKIELNRAIDQNLRLRIGIVKALSLCSRLAHKF